jgi:hypothetical protein
METDLVCVLTTIQPPTLCVQRLSEALAAVGASLVVIGDRKGPFHFDLPGAAFYSLAEQKKLPFRVATLLPEGHYSRKNLGYLLALERGARCIYETDDDNAPTPSWQPRRRQVRTRAVDRPGWVNVYRAFSDDPLWPRGFPLEQVNRPGGEVLEASAKEVEVDAPIQQGLADGAPDVDAVWRLILDREITFRPGPSVRLAPGSWCPFNSQSTWWWPEAYPLLYLPTHCSFRMTDIWRGFIAQRCLWELGRELVFHAAEVVQLRNPHALLRDFADEVPGYLHNHDLVRHLASLALRPGPAAVADNLVHCYEALVAGNFLPAAELPLVRAWVEDVSRQVARPQGQSALAA